MLEERGYAIGDPVERSGEEAEVVAEFVAARETTLLVETDPDLVSAGDVVAVNAYRAVYDHLLAERSTP
jgi:hypothetical protein